MQKKKEQLKEQRKLNFNYQDTKAGSVTKFLFVLLSVLCAFVGQSQVPQAVMQQVYEEVKTPYKYGMVITPADSLKKIDCPSVYRKGKNWYMTYIQFTGRGYETWLAKSKNLLEWKTLGRIMSFSDTTDAANTPWDANQ